MYCSVRLMSYVLSTYFLLISLGVALEQKAIRVVSIGSSSLGLGVKYCLKYGDY